MENFKLPKEFFTKDNKLNTLGVYSIVFLTIACLEYSLKNINDIFNKSNELESKEDSLMGVNNEKDL